ncbi:MAG TPA: Ig-like domain-containing protein [Bacteroidota bacterium]|nr:Ig-like domain-containing protein [Bacteroidota bacterium]
MKHTALYLLAFCTFLSAANAQQNQKLSLTVTTPLGLTQTPDQYQTIVATFNQPMTALREVPEDEGTGPMIIEPAVAGKYRWMGTATIAFIPAKRLPYGTLFTVKIPAGTKSVSGQSLATEYSWQFQTVRPAVINMSPYNGDRYVELDHGILLRFNQKVDPQVAARYISVEEHGNGVAYTAQIAPEKTHWGDNSILLTPAQPFKRGTSYTVRCRQGLPGVEGPLGMVNDFAFSFTTYGDLNFVRVKNGDRFNPAENLTLVFTNPVSPKDLIDHLSFQPPLRIEPDEYYEEYTTEEPSLRLPLKPEQDYVGIIAPGLKDRFRNVTKDTVKFTFRTGSYPPSVRMTTGQGVLEAYEAHKVPVTFTNVDSVLLQMGRINPDRIVPVMLRLDYSTYQRLAWEQAILEWVDSKSEDTSQFSASRYWKPRLPRNERGIRPVNLDEVLGKAARGVVLVQVDNLFQDPNRRRYLKTLVQVTNFGITAKFSPDNNLIWVTNLKDASPIADASVEIRNDSNQVLWTGTTNAKGTATSPGWGKLGLKTVESDYEGEGDEGWDYGGRQPRLWVIVKKAGDVAFTSSQWNEGIEPWQFGVSYDWNPKFETLEGELFTDRGLYKAGEMVNLKGILRARREGDWRIPKNIPLRFSVKNTRNEDILATEPKPDRFGSFADSVRLKPTAPLGYYTATIQTKKTVKGKDRWVFLASESFRVEAFRPAEFETNVTIDNALPIVGDTLTGLVSARYLFGAALKGAPVTWRVSTSQTLWEPEGFDSYRFGPMYWLSSYSRGGHNLLSGTDTVLDDQGVLRVRTPLRVGEIQGTQSLLVEADVTSPSRQVISGRSSVILHGAEFYVGIAPSSTFTKTDSALPYKIVAVSPAGTYVPDIPLSLRIVRRIWRSVRKAETGGRYVWESQTADSTVDQGTITSSTKPLEGVFKPTEPGFYYFEVKATDKRKNPVLTNAYFYVSGPRYVAWERSNDDRIELIADKTEYKPGESAAIIVKSPYEKATALISIEREGIISHYTTELVGSAPQIDIPILRTYLPNVFVSVVLLQGRVEAAAITKEADVGRPSFKIGYVNLPVSPKTKQLTVSVETDKKEYRPGDVVTMTVTTKNAAGTGVSADVALSVADLGVLNLVNYRMPNPFFRFYGQRGLAVTTTETRIHLIQQRDYGEKGEDDGGGGGEGAENTMDAEGIRKDFRPSAYWNPSVMTNASGKATVSFRLPDNLTSFQAMAVAQTLESDFGYGDMNFKVNKPLLLQPSLPRFARIGDTFEGGVVIMNYTDAEKQVRLITSVKGIQFRGSDTAVYVLKPGQSKEVRNTYYASMLGTAEFTFRASTATDRDGLFWKIPIEVPRLRETVALYESTVDPSRQERIQIPKNVFDGLGDIQCSLASTAMVGLSGGISYLFSYPYGCLEQRLTHVLPMILAKDLVEAFKFEVLRDTDYRPIVAKMLDEVPLFQRSDGGFTYWKNTDDTWPYLSAFTMYTLVQAERHGYPLDATVKQRGMSYLRDVLNGRVRCWAYSEAAWSCTRALCLYTLAVNGTPEFGYMEKLYNDRATIGLFAKAYLLKALSASKGNPAMIGELVRDLTNTAKVAPTSAHFEERPADDWYWIYHSNTRTTALILQALVETQPENSLIPKVVRWLIDAQKNGCWRTTQENWYVVDALATYFKAYEKEEPNFTAEVRVAGGELMKELFKGRSLNTVSKAMTLDELQKGVEYPMDFLKDGPGRLYYTVRMNYYPTTQTKAKDEGLSVMKNMERFAPGPDSIPAISAGAISKVTLTIATNQARNYVVVDDPVPAGLEIVNTSFSTTGVNLAEQEHAREDWWNYNPFRHREMYDDKALFFADYLPAGVYTLTYLVRATSYGTFQAPATRAEGMYEPEVFGQTASKLIRVQ